MPAISSVICVAIAEEVCQALPGLGAHVCPPLRFQYPCQLPVLRGARLVLIGVRGVLPQLQTLEDKVISPLSRVLERLRGSL